MPDPHDFVTFAEGLADAAGPLVCAAWASDLVMEFKPDGSALTRADLEIEALWRAAIRDHFPDHGILGEEEGLTVGNSAYTWVLDPIDGTRQFGMGLANHACLIALCHNEEPILGIIDMPLVRARVVGVTGQGTAFNGRAVQTSGRAVLSEARFMFGNPDSFPPAELRQAHALHAGVRMTSFDAGSPAYAALARGALDLCLNGPDLDAFDICALVPVIEGAGGVISDWQGNRLGLRSSGAIMASASAGLHDQALSALNG